MTSLPTMEAAARRPAGLRFGSRALPMLRSTALGAVAVTLTLAGSARAAEGQGASRFGTRGIVVSAERLIPLISYESVKTTPADGGSFTQSRVSLGLLSNGPFTAFGTFYNLPRLAFDWLPTDNLTIGGATWLYTQLSATDTTSSGGTSQATKQPKVTYWGFSPRIGYVIALGHTVSLWPRGGLEYHNVSSSSAGDVDGPTVHQIAVAAEAVVVISPWNHFGFTVGPTADIPVAGKTTSKSTTGTGTGGAATSTDIDSAMLQLGVSAGMLGHF